MSRALLRTAAVITLATTPLVAQRAALPHIDGAPRTATPITRLMEPAWLPSRTAPADPAEAGSNGASIA